AAGSAGAMTAIFERHHEALHRYCWSIVGNGHDAADALQNTMIKALRALPGETREIALRPWLYRIAHNESISLLRARRPDSALDGEAIRRTIADGDRRALRGMRVRGHLRSCAGCQDFELAMRTRPQQFAAIVPPLPAAAAAAILQSVVGGGGGAGGGGMLAW